MKGRHRNTEISNRSMGLICYVLIPLGVLLGCAGGGKSDSANANDFDVVINGCTFGQNGATVLFSVSNFSLDAKTGPVILEFRDSNATVVKTITTKVVVKGGGVVRGSQQVPLKNVLGGSCTVGKAP